MNIHWSDHWQLRLKCEALSITKKRSPITATYGVLLQLLNLSCMGVLFVLYWSMVVSFGIISLKRTFSFWRTFSSVLLVGRAVAGGTHLCSLGLNPLMYV